MKLRVRSSFVLVILALLWTAGTDAAQTKPATQAGPGAAPANPPVQSQPAVPPKPAPGEQKPAQPQTPALTTDQIIDRLIEREKFMIQRLKAYRPILETYIQNLEPHDELGTVPKGDKYFLGKLDLSKGVNQKSLMANPGWASSIKNKFTQLYSVRYLPNGFAQMIMIDASYFDRNNYDFLYVKREFLGEVKTLVYDVKPNPASKTATFWGRIWVEDRDYSIVRFNGTYGPNMGSDLYFHFDSWRENITENLWLPAYVYTEETDMSYFMGQRKLRFKGQTRLWGYNVAGPDQQNEFTHLTVDEGVDAGERTEDISPVSRYRAWERHAEDNILTRMQKAGLIAPSGEVDKVLETVITNLEVTNNLQIEPPVRARVLLTSPIESFTIGRTIILSRGFLDVLPDEASLAMILAHELAHIALGHRLDTKYAFNDRMLFQDEETFQRLFIKRDKKEEAAADTKAAELLNNSPYKDKLANAGLFLRAVDARAKTLPQLLRPHLGDFIVRDSKVRRMADLMQAAPDLDQASIEQVAALPLGGRIRLNSWNNQISLVKTPPVALLHPREKMPFEVTPVLLFLTRLQQGQTNVAAKQN